MTERVVDLEEAVFTFPTPSPLQGVKGPNKAVIRVNKAGFRYTTGGGAAIAVKDVDLSLSLASRVALRGSCSEGRSMLLKVLTEQHQHTEGTILKVQGLTMAYLATTCLRHLEQHLHRTPVQYILWRFDGYLDREQNATVAPAGCKRIEQSAVEKHLEDFGLGSDLASQAGIGELTPGMRARLALAAAMWRRPHVLVIDDFAGHLDLEDVSGLILAIERYGGGVVINSKDEGFHAVVPSEVWVLDGGSLHVEAGPAGNCKARPSLTLGRGEFAAESRMARRKQIKDLEKRILEARTSPMTDVEMEEVFNQLQALKEVLLNHVDLQEDGGSDDDLPATGLGRHVDEQLRDLLMEEFGADMKNFRRTQQEFGLKLSLLVEQCADEAEPELDLLGFLAYKTWGPPVPCVSIGAVGVSHKHRGKGYGRKLMKVAEERASLLGRHASQGAAPAEVRLRSLATAVDFYERLGYERVDEGEDCKPAERTPGCPDPESSRRTAEEDDEDAPCVPMLLRCGPLSPGTASKLEPLTPKLDPWSPKKSRALEDGPTWPPMADFMLPGTETPPK